MSIRQAIEARRMPIHQVRGDEPASMIVADLVRLIE